MKNQTNNPKPTKNARNGEEHPFTQQEVDLLKIYLIEMNHKEHHRMVAEKE